MMATYLDLLLSFFQIGILSFGGGMAALPLISQQVVDKHGWLTLEEFTNLITISEMTPGPIGINSSTFVGVRVAGIPGALIATFGCVLPSCAIVMLLGYIYYRYKGLSMVQGVLAGLRPAVIAMIASAGLSLLILALYGSREITGNIWSINPISLLIFGVGIFLLRHFKASPISIMLGAGAAGIILYYLF